MKRFFAQLISLNTPSRLIVVSFALFIVSGTFLLLPSMTVRENISPNSFIQALFTATSAVCVTGLTVRDTGMELSTLGQAIVLLLIQVGGLGILTFSNLFLLLYAGRVDITQRMALKETHGSLLHLPIRTLILYIFLYTFLIELAGAAILTLRFLKDYSLGSALWLGTFHSVSAFCNAGFSLFPDSLARYRHDVVINLTIMLLVIMGGLGFVVLADITYWAKGLRNVPRVLLSLHSRTVLITSGLLILGGALLIAVLESNGQASAGSWFERLLESVFLAVSGRTAGFNTLQTAQLTNGTLLIIILLMMVGGSPGSTAGGIKTTTLAVLYALIVSQVRNCTRVELMRRSVPSHVVAKALMTMAVFLLIVLVSVILLQITELGGVPHSMHRGNFLEYLFEVVSALGTVGLSTGITTGLSTAGKLIIIGCMFIGRLSPLLIANSLIGMRQQTDYSYPEEDIIVG